LAEQRSGSRLDPHLTKWTIQPCRWQEKEQDDDARAGEHHENEPAVWWRCTVDTQPQQIGAVAIATGGFTADSAVGITTNIEVLKPGSVTDAPVLTTGILTGVQ